MLELDGVEYVYWGSIRDTYVNGVWIANNDNLSLYISSDEGIERDSPAIEDVPRIEYMGFSYIEYTYHVNTILPLIEE